MSKHHKSKKMEKLHSEVTKTIALPSSKSTFIPKPKPPCHKVTEIFRKFYLGGINQVKTMVKDIGVDVLIPLDSLDGNVWDWGFTGKIAYYPINDFEVLPTDILDRLVEEILTYLEEGKLVGMFCMGGHGRTGYIAACVLGLLGVEDPIDYIRTNYCIKAIESNEQVRAISKFLHKPELYTKYKEAYDYGAYYGSYYGAYGGYGFNEEDAECHGVNEDVDLLNFYERLWGKHSE